MNIVKYLVALSLFFFLLSCSNESSTIKMKCENDYEKKFYKVIGSKKKFYERIDGQWEEIRSRCESEPDELIITNKVIKTKNSIDIRCETGKVRTPNEKQENIKACYVQPYFKIGGYSNIQEECDKCGDILTYSKDGAMWDSSRELNSIPCDQRLSTKFTGLLIDFEVLISEEFTYYNTGRYKGGRKELTCNKIE